MTRQKVAVVTGAGSGLGQSVAVKLAEKGINVSVVDISEDGGQETVKMIEENGAKAIFVKADVSKAEDVKNYVDQTVKEFGTIDMFYNNAGISGPGTNFVENTIEQIDQVIDINMRGALYGIKYVLEVMLKNGGGAIVNTSSTAGLVGQETVGTYSATKHGIIGITKTIAAEYAAQGIRSNAVAPGATETPMVAHFMERNPDAAKNAIDPVPQKRLGQPKEVANTVAFLLSEDAAYINGAVVPIDGGFTAI
ncbi:SDR family NAD(P)-dependent oxidoreductase [Gracilibacillus salinarum]|uniref:Glucose 1-dehydrogenase n=1 Tax=Gracilibacillus salinarum TaxID=2932255 RepID=A0ABY4GKL4_9BACI|nr:glucose 1-dehydrogenase [Gracilibacillus salinarum]UOQ84711.1 glucose 1-dehydrogenase [Gracilibacillus salinarum]